MKKPIRYIKIENTTNHNSSYPYVYWVEIEAINSVGENVLLGKLPIKLLDSNNSAHTSPELATDGIKDSAYSYMYSGYVNFVKYDLGEVHEDLEKILIFQGFYGSKYAKVSVSVDNLTWETIYESYETITWYDSPNYYEAVVPNHVDFSTPDTTPPSFDYISDVILDYGDEFDPLDKVVALDDRDGDITEDIVVVGVVNSEESGDYKITYIVSDSSGNMAVKERVVTILPEPVEEDAVASVELQRTIYSELSAGDYPVKEVVPVEVKEMPLITFSDLNRETDFTKTNTDRFTYTIMIHGWSVGKSSLEAKTIEEFIYQTIMNLTTTRNYKVEMVNLLMTNNVREDESGDRVTFHSIQQFEITISKLKGER